MSPLSATHSLSSTARVGRMLVALVLVFVVHTASAGSTDGFDIILDLMEGWLSGGLGKTIAIAALVITVVFCISKQSVAPGLTFVGVVALLLGGLGLTNVAFTGMV